MMVAPPYPSGLNMSLNPCPLCSAERPSLEAACPQCDWAPGGSRGGEGQATVSDPFRAPLMENAASGGSPASAIVLTAMWLATGLFATINTVVEEYPLLEGGWFLVALALASQTPGLFIGLWGWRSSSRRAKVSLLPLLIGAYVVAITGFLAYLGYAFDEKADSINSAAHMHVVAFPILHCIFAFLTYVVCGIISLSLHLSIGERDRSGLHRRRPL